MASEHTEHADRPELRHHFADEEQQRNAASLGMWWFLGTEIMFFGGMFCAYLVYRLKYFPEFAVASRSLDLKVGTLNTAVLICSSLTVAQAVRAAQMGKRMLQVKLLLATCSSAWSSSASRPTSGADKYKEHHIPTFDFSARESDAEGRGSPPAGPGQDCRTIRRRCRGEKRRFRSTRRFSSPFTSR